MTRLRVGTRGSALALVQTELVRARLTERRPDVEIEVIEVVTRGDADQETPLASSESAGWFTSAIQDAILRGEIDVAVHSYKDLPTKRTPGLIIAAVPLREDPRDALVSLSGQRLRELPKGARVGTSSPRRTAQALAVRRDLRIEPIRGNVDTRVRKVRDGEYDAAIIAIAGLKRLGRESEAAQVFGYEEMLPAPAQGALAVECRASDQRVLEILRSIDDPQLRPLVTAERTFLATLEAGCSFPAGAYAEAFGTTLKLNAFVAHENRIIRSKVGGPIGSASGLGRALAEELMTLAGLGNKKR